MGRIRLRLSLVTPSIVLLVSTFSSVLGQWSNPNGLVRPIRNTAMNCGNCPPGYQRDQGAYGMCGPCVPENKSCTPGYVLVGNQCNQCPCPSTDRNFGTSCRVDVDGQITCQCPEGYAGRDCSQCAPGAVQSNQYPYNCIRVNQTSSVVSPGCPPGNYCPAQPVSQVVGTPLIPPPPQQTACPTNNCYPSQPCPVPSPPNPWPQPVVVPPQPCPVPIPGPGPILCPTQPVQCPPCPIPGNNPCIPTQPQQPCPVPCPVVPPQPCVPNGPCPAPPQPCLPNLPYPCPVPPQPPQPCIPNGNCPITPVIPQLPCPPCPTCPSTCPSPCPQIPNPGPCNQCPDPCQRCPDIPNCPMCPPCPNCPQIPPCNPCPNPCPPCYPGGGGCNVTCPDTCKACPQCPDCRLDVTCPGVGLNITLPCICDPRGTVSQYGETCFCKTNVGGQRCNTCKPGYFALAGNRTEGCIPCWGSGVSSYCSAAIFYRSWIEPSRTSDCSIELTDEASTIVYNSDSRGKFSWDGKEARLSLTVSTRLFWSLPGCFKGNRLTSYGGILRFSRMFTGSGAGLGPDNDVIIVGGNGARLYYSSFRNQTTGLWEKLEVLLDESTHMIFYKNGDSRVATRFDILEVLADVHLILIRATFTGTTLSTSIRDVALGTVSKWYTGLGFVLVIEQARCPTGYQGLSCEVWTKVITVTLDPFWVRDCEDTEIDFTCTFTTNSKRILMMRLGPESNAGYSSHVTSLSRTYTLNSTLGRIKCEILDQSDLVWATVYAATKIEPCVPAVVVPPKTITIVTDDFICVDEGEKVAMTANVFYYGSITVRPDWYKEGEIAPRYNGPEFVIHSARMTDNGTYIVAALQGDTMDVKHVSLIVRPKYPKNPSDDPKILMIEDGGGPSAYAFNKSTQSIFPIKSNTSYYNNANKTKPKWAQFQPPQTPIKPSILHSMQKDQAVDGYPSVIVEPTEIRAQVGETVTLQCNASGEEPMKFYWKSGSSDYIPVHVRVSRGALIFKAIKKEDEGSYYCVAWNHIGQVTARATILVTEKPVVVAPVAPPLTVFISKMQVEVAEGHHAYFNCSTNNPNVKPMWSKKNDELPKSSEVMKNGTLIIYRVRSSDAGVYVCKAMGPGGSMAEVEATLGFIPAMPSTIPSISFNPKSPVKRRSGEQVRIECTASGYPTPNITWFRSLEGSEKMLITSQGNLTALEIAHLTKADEGKYTCTASNVAGSKSESLSLIVDDVILCKLNEFRCKSGDQCVPKEDRCDNERDCKDGSDEHHCRKRSRRQASKS
ncbi:Basement membrane proteoglycan [Folsomia candida]|uniref:Basement membrane proteoglycan n=1 Tax=Folsomia candida TaxID=158441 RepID=A0A226E2S5_FOLCA|nr:Basement membrane proteoglycan [Folsomia candida]